MRKQQSIQRWRSWPDRGDDPPRIGLIGYGAFGRLVAKHLRPWFPIFAYDPLYCSSNRQEQNVEFAELGTVAACEIVVIATPVFEFASVIKAALPFLKQGSLVLDVGSVKVIPSEIMLEMIPEGIDIVATHPLFGPESARDGIEGMKIAICPLKGRGMKALTRFLRLRLGLQVIETTPHAHDKEVATSQALVHLIAKVLVQMEPLPKLMTTASFDLLMRSIEMVRYDAPSVFSAIEHSNPYAADVRRRFFEMANDVGGELVQATTLDSLSQKNRL